MDGSLPSFEERIAYIRSTHELEDQIVELAGHLNAANYRFLALLAEFDRRKGWNCRATRDCAHWLNWKCGIDLGAAREKVRTARALEKLPLVSAAMERGEISYSNVRAITRVATPENEHYFLQIALSRHCASRRDAGPRLSTRDGSARALARASTADESRSPLLLGRTTARLS